MANEKFDLLVERIGHSLRTEDVMGAVHDVVDEETGGMFSDLIANQPDLLLKDEHYWKHFSAILVRALLVVALQASEVNLE